MNATQRTFSPKDKETILRIGFNNKVYKGSLTTAV